MNKASGGDGIPPKLFKILKCDVITVLHLIGQQICKTQQWPQDWESQFSFQSLKRAMPRNVQATTQLHSSHVLARKRQWHPTPVLLPGKSHGRRSLVGCSHGVAKSRTGLSYFTFTFHFHALEKKMATHSSVLAWRIPGMGEPGGLPSMGSHRVGHD